MRILLINKFHYVKRGAEVAYFDTARILTDAGHTVAFFSMEHPKNAPTEWSRFFVSQADYSGDGGGFFAKAKMALRIIWNREAQKKLTALIEEFQPDIAHLHNIYHQLSPSILWTLKKHKVPLVMTLHDYKVLSPNHDLFVRGKIWEHTSGWRCLVDRCVKDSFLKSLDAAVEKWLHDFLGSYRLIQRFISPSQFLIDLFRKHGKELPFVKIAQPLLPFPEKTEAAGSNSFLYWGALSPEKGVGLLLDVFKELPQEKLLIIGAGPDEKVLHEKKERLKLFNVEFLGAIYGEKLFPYVEKAKAILIPSMWYDNMPYVPLEALARGKIVIAAKSGGIPERIADGVNGFLFEMGNKEELLRKIKDLSHHDLLKISEAARKSTEDLRPEAYKMALESLYLEILKQRKD